MRSRLSALACLVAGVSCLGNSACYAYLEPRTGDVAAVPGATVRLTLSDSGSVVLRPLIGPSAEAIEGTLVSDTSRAFVVHASSVSYRTGSEAGWRGETLTIDKSLISVAGVRQFSPGRTALFAGATLAMFLGVKQIFAGVGSGATTIGGSPKPGNQ